MIKKLLKSVREYKKDSLITPMYVALEAILDVLIPFFMAKIIDEGIAKGDMNYVYKMGFILVIVAMVALCFGALSGKYAAKASAGFAKNLRKDMFYNIQNFSFSNIDKFSTPSLVTRLTTDVTNVQNAYQMIIRVAVRAPFMLVFALFMSMTINSELSVVFFFAIPILGVGLFTIALAAHPFFKQVFRRYDKLNSIVQENVTAVRVVKAYVREDYEIEKFEELSEEIFGLFKRAEKIVAFNGPLMELSMYTCILLISYLSARFIVGGAMTTGQLMSMIVYATQILSALMMLSMVFVMIIIAKASTDRIVEVLDEESDLKNPENPIYKINDGSINFNNVSFSYIGDPNKLALKDLNFRINSGETIGIIGGTGSAKTSLVQLIPRLYDVTSGSVEVAGIDVRNYDIETLRDEVAMVLQKNVLFSGTIRENLKWGNQNLTDEEMIRVCKLAQAHDFVKDFPDGYDSILDQGGTNLSGGQKQRLSIARALLKKPKILILDDSTSAVDTKTDSLIRQAFRDEIPNTTKIIIAQRISSIEDADKVIVMDNGEINGFGSPNELLQHNKIYQEVYNSQVKGAESNE